jgi:hypothetical protein
MSRSHMDTVHLLGLAWTPLPTKYPVKTLLSVELWVYPLKIT